jgi:hypothetical protein
MAQEGIKGEEMNWIIDKYYYIINFEYFLRPRIYPVYFVNKRAAKRAIHLHEPSRRYQSNYEIIRGSKLKEFEATYVLKLGRLGSFTKYPYPKELKTRQARKSYRTQMRRRLRRMGMLTNVKNKYGVKDKPGIIKVKRNRQWVAETPYTTCVCFALESKPHKHFIIIKKNISQKRGKLFELQVLEIDEYRYKFWKCHPDFLGNVRDWCLKKKVTIKRKDIIIPYLITELIKIYGDSILARARKEKVGFDHPKQKAVLSLHAKKLV